jgi:hypothetical protein
MPQYGQVPGPLLTTFGCIAQVKRPPAGGLGAIAAPAAGAEVGDWGAATGPPMFIPAMLGPAIGMEPMLIPAMDIPQQEPPL